MHCKRSYRNSSEVAFTLLEILVVFTIFGLLLTGIFAVFTMGLSAWNKTSAKNELLQQTQITNIRLARELEKSTSASLSADTPLGVVAFLSAMNDDGRFVHDAGGSPEWQKYVIYYLDATEQIVYRRELPLPIGSPQRTAPKPIDSFNSGTGIQALANYATEGQPLSRHVVLFEPAILPDSVNQLTWRLSAEQKRYGSERPELIETTATALLRN